MNVKLIVTLEKGTTLEGLIEIVRKMKVAGEAAGAREVRFNRREESRFAETARESSS